MIWAVQDWHTVSADAVPFPPFDLEELARTMERLGPAPVPTEIRPLSTQLAPLGYPELPDDGTWDGEGGYVGRREPTAFVLDQPVSFYAPIAQQGRMDRVLYVDRETYAAMRLEGVVP